MAGGWGTSASCALPASAKVQDELDTVVGQARTPSLEDPERLPYTMPCCTRFSTLLVTSPRTPACAVTCYPWCPTGLGILRRGQGVSLTKINRNKTLRTRNKVHFPPSF